MTNSGQWQYVQAQLFGFKKFTVIWVRRTKLPKNLQSCWWFLSSDTGKNLHRLILLQIWHTISSVIGYGRLCSSSHAWLVLLPYPTCAATASPFRWHSSHRLRHVHVVSCGQIAPSLTLLRSSSLIHLSPLPSPPQLQSQAVPQSPIAATRKTATPTYSLTHLFAF